MKFEQFTDVMYRPWRIDPGFSWHSDFCVPELEYFVKPRSGLKYLVLVPISGSVKMRPFFLPISQQ